MRALLQLTLCIFAGFVPCVVGCLHFEAIPTTIIFGMTKEITINCTFRYTESSAIINVTEISVARSNTSLLNNMVTIKRPQNVIDTSVSSDLTADGFFDVNDLSALTVRVKGPVVGDAGAYVCLVKGLDATGRKHEAVEFLSVTFIASEEICPKVNREGTVSFFFPSLSYKGSKYYLSKFEAANSSIAEDLCSEIGGYLIEVNDYEELQMAYQLTKQYNRKMTMIAGTDAEQEGVWIFPRTGRPVGITNWDKDQPDNYGDEDCRAISFFHRKDRLNDIYCEYDMSFICEVSQTPEYVVAV